MKKESSTGPGTEIFDGIVKAAQAIGSLLKFGLPALPITSIPFYFSLTAVIFLIYSLVMSGKIVAFALWIFPGFSHGWVTRNLSEIAVVWQVLALTVFSLVVFAISLGVGGFLKWKSFQTSMDRLSLKDGIGRKPEIKNVRAEKDHRTRLLVTSEGIGIDRFEAKKLDMEASFGAVVESVRVAGNPKFVEILLAAKRLPTLCHYLDLVKHLKKPASFLVGESIGGIVTQSLSDLPHLLIAGTTGGGKSVFFKQALLGILESTPRLQMYLLDLKGGIEMKELSELPNVKIAKDEAEAVKLLRSVEQEMKRRFAYMEEKGIKKIDPDSDKMDLIVVGVDEASVLYTSSRGRGTRGGYVEEARILTDSLAKLARAAGIHLILATQKVTKETIETKIQENIGGRVCFRMNTLQGSLTVLGNKRGLELPDIPGRAIWSVGAKFIEVQAPFVSDIEVIRVCADISESFKSKKRENFQEMLKPVGDAETTVSLRKIRTEEAA